MYMPPVVVRKKIVADDIMALIEGKIAAIRIQDFCSKSLSKTVSKKLLSHPNRGSFNKANDVERIGIAQFEIDGPEKLQEYSDQAMKGIHALRDVFKPYVSPIDNLRLLLEEAWPAGANMETLFGKKCFVGICRILEPSISLLPHNDRFDRATPDNVQAHELLGQLAANIYLQVPEQGGELELWTQEPSDEEYLRLKDEDGYGISRDKLAAPAHLIRPDAGELVIFNPRRLHGVRSGSGSQRICVGAFVGYRGKDLPLSYWS